MPPASGILAVMRTPSLRFVLAAAITVMVVSGPISQANALVTQDDCVAGEYFDGGDCVPCPPGTFQPLAAQGSCLDAEPGHRAPGPRAVAQEECPAGTYQPSGAQAGCLDADPGRFVPGTGAIAQLDCAPGSYQPAAGTTDNDDFVRLNL